MSGWWFGLLLFTGIWLGACGGGPSNPGAIVDQSLIRLDDLPPDAWIDAAAAPDDLLELTDFLGLTPQHFQAAPACAPFAERLQDELVDFAHVAPLAQGAAAWRTGLLPLSQVLVVHALAVYRDAQAARDAERSIAAILADQDAAGCLNALVADAASGLGVVEAMRIMPLLSLPGAQGFAFRVAAVVLIVPVQVHIEAQIVTRGSTLSVLLQVDYNGGFVDEAGQRLLDRLDARLRAATSPA